MRWLLIPLLLLASSSARAAEPECQGDLCAVPLAKGATAPFAGQLLSTLLAIRLGQKADACEERIKIEVTAAARAAAVALELERRLRQIDAEAARQRTAAYEHAAPRWWERPPVIAAVTVLLTVGAMLGTAHLVAAVGR